MDELFSLSDEKLQKLAADGDASAREALTSRYIDLVSSCVQPYYYMEGGETADLIQEGMVGFLSAVEGYDDSEGVPFRAYAMICIRRRIFSAIRSAARLKHAPLNRGVSFDETEANQSRESNTRFVLDQRRTPEEQVLAKESEKEFFQSFLRCLSPYEQKILPLYLDGHSYRSMSEITGRTTKAVDNAVQRIRRKLARFLPSGEISES